MRTTETMDSVGKTRPANSAKVAILLSDHQSASTEMAELISKHPCGVSFDELLMDSTGIYATI